MSNPPDGPKANEEEKDFDEESYQKLEDCSFTSISDFKVYLPFLDDVLERCQEEHTGSIKTLIRLITRPAWSARSQDLNQIRLVVEKLKFSFKLTWNRFLRATKKSFYKRNKDVSKLIPGSTALLTTCTTTAPTTTKTSTVCSGGPTHNIEQTLTTIECTTISSTTKMKSSEEEYEDSDDNHYFPPKRRRRKVDFDLDEEEEWFKPRQFQHRPRFHSQRHHHPRQPHSNRFRARFHHGSQPCWDSRRGGIRPKHYAPERYELEDRHSRNYFDDPESNHPSRHTYSSSSKERRKRSHSRHRVSYRSPPRHRTHSGRRVTRLAPPDSSRQVDEYEGFSRRSDFVHSEHKKRSGSPTYLRRKVTRLGPADSSRQVDECEGFSRRRTVVHSETRVVSTDIRQHKEERGTRQRLSSTSIESREVSSHSRHHEDDRDFMPRRFDAYETRVVSSDTRQYKEDRCTRQRYSSSSAESREASSHSRHHEDDRDLTPKRFEANESREASSHSRHHEDDSDLTPTKFEAYETQSSSFQDFDEFHLESKDCSQSSTERDETKPSFHGSFDEFDVYYGYRQSSSEREEVSRNSRWDMMQSVRVGDDTGLPSTSWNDESDSIPPEPRLVIDEPRDLTGDDQDTKDMDEKELLTPVEIARKLELENQIAGLVQKRKEAQYQSLKTKSLTYSISTIQDKTVKTKESHIGRLGIKLEEAELQNKSTNVSQSEKIRTKDSNIEKRKLSFEDENILQNECRNYSGSEVLKAKGAKIQKSRRKEKFQSVFKNATQSEEKTFNDPNIQSDKTTSEDKDVSQNEGCSSFSKATSEKGSANEIRSPCFKPARSTIVKSALVEPKPVTTPSDSERMFLNLDEVMEPVRQKNKSRSRQQIEPVLQEPPPTELKKHKDSQQEHTPLKPEPAESEVDRYSPIFDKVISEYDKVRSKVGEVPKAGESVSVCLSQVEDGLKSTTPKAKRDDSSCLNTDVPKIPPIIEPSSNSKRITVGNDKQSSSKSVKIVKINVTKYDGKITLTDKGVEHDEEQSPEKYTSKSISEIEDDIIRRPFKAKIPFLGNQSDDEEEILMETQRKKENVKGGVSSKEPENMPHQSPSITVTSPSSSNSSTSKSLKSRLSEQIATFHKVGSPYGGALRGLKNDNIEARRMASLKTGAIFDLQKEDKKPQRALAKNKNNLQLNTGFGLNHTHLKQTSNENKPILSSNLSNISQEELKRIVETNLSNLPDPPIINLVNSANPPRNEIPTRITTESNQNSHIQHQNTSMGWPINDPRREIGRNLSQTHKYPFDVNISSDNSLHSNRSCASEANSTYNPPVLQTDPFRSPCYDGSSTPDPYRPDPYSLSLAQNFPKSNLTSPANHPMSPMFDMPKTPLLETPPSPYMQFDSYSSNLIHSSERDNFQRNPLVYHPMLVSNNNTSHRSLLGPHPISYERAQFNQHMMRSPYNNVPNNMYTSRTPNTYAAWRAEKYGLRPKVAHETSPYHWKAPPVNMITDSESHESDVRKKENEIKKLSIRDPRRRSTEEPTKTDLGSLPLGSLPLGSLHERDPRRRNRSPPMQLINTEIDSSSDRYSLNERSRSRSRSRLSPENHSEGSTSSKDRSRSRSRRRDFSRDRPRSRSRRRDSPERSRNSEKYSSRDRYISPSDRRRRHRNSTERFQSRSRDRSTQDIDKHKIVKKLKTAETNFSQIIEDKELECETSSKETQISGINDEKELTEYPEELKVHPLETGKGSHHDTNKNKEPTKSTDIGNESIFLPSPDNISSAHITTSGLNSMKGEDHGSAIQKPDSKPIEETIEMETNLKVSDKSDYITNSSKNANDKKEEKDYVEKTDHQEISTVGSSADVSGTYSMESEEKAPKDMEQPEEKLNPLANACENKEQNVEPPEPSIMSPEVLQRFEDVFGVPITADMLQSIQSLKSFLSNIKPGVKVCHQTNEEASVVSNTTDSTNKSPNEVQIELTSVDSENLQPLVGDENMTDSETHGKEGRRLSKPKSGYKKTLRGKAKSSKKSTVQPKLTAKKGKKKNELDKLQDDISKYHDSEAIAAASGPRKCRLLKEKSMENHSVQASQSKKVTKKEVLKKNTNPNKSKLSPSHTSYDSSDSDAGDSDAGLTELTEFSKNIQAKYAEYIKTSDIKESDTMLDKVKRDLSSISTNSNEFSNTPKEAVGDKRESSLPKGQSSQEIKNHNAQEPICSTHMESLDIEAQISNKEVVASKNTNNTEVNVDSKIPKDSESDSDRMSNHSSNSTKKTKKRKSWSAGIIKKKPKTKKTPNEPKHVGKDIIEMVDQNVTDDVENIECDEDQNVENNLADPKYYQDGDFKAIKCKLCSFKGKGIVSHYTISHPKDEVVISRMSPEVAELAVKESNLFFNKRLVKNTKFTCRFCRQTFLKYLVFFEHLALHSGEYRHECCKCGYRTSTKSGIVKHYHTVHDNTGKVNCRVLYKEPVDKTHLNGFLCLKCNFFQLSENSVKRHLILTHDKVDASELVKINCSLLNYDDADYDTIDCIEDQPSNDNEESTIVNSGNTDTCDPANKESNLIAPLISLMSIENNETVLTIDETAVTEKKPETSTHQEEKPQEISQEVSQQVPQVAQEVSQQVAQQVPQEVAQEVSQQVPQEVSQEVPHEVSQEVPHEVSQEVSQQVPHEVSQEVSQQVSQEVSQQVPQEAIDEISISFSPDLSNQKTTDLVDTKEGMPPTSCFEPTKNCIDLNTLQEKHNETYKTKCDEVIASISVRRNKNYKIDMVKTINLKLTNVQEESASLLLKDFIEENCIILKTPTVENVSASECGKVDVDSPVRRQQLERTCKLQKLNSDNCPETDMTDFDLALLFKYIDEPSEGDGSVDDFNTAASPTPQNSSSFKSSKTSLLLFKNQIERCRESVQKAFKTQPQTKVYQSLVPENLNTSEFTYVMQKIADLTVKQSENHTEIIVGGFRAVRFDNGMMFSCKLKIFNKSCDFETTVLTDFGKHVNVSHQNCYWDGVCASCFTVFIEDPVKHVKTSVHTQSVAFCHFVCGHLRFDTSDGTFQSSIREEPESPVEPPRIRVRRLSGDMLSTPGAGVDNSLVNTGAVLMSPPKETLLPGVPPSADSAMKLKLHEYYQTDFDSKALSLFKMRIERYKTRIALVNMLQRQKLRQFYKCMGYNCSFTAVYFKDFAIHYDQHKDIHDLSPGNDPHKGYWRICAYCNEEIFSDMEFGSHLRKHHSGCLYQCGYCFFRAKSIANVGHHLSLEHENNPVVILECEDLEKIVCEAPEERSFTYYAPPMLCNTGNCNVLTYMTTRYIGHLLDMHQLDTFFRCFLCTWASDDIVAFLQHLKDKHNFGLFQCKYCQYGSYAESEMKTHLCYKHPEQVPISILRIQCQAPANVNKHAQQEVMQKTFYNRKEVTKHYLKYLVPLPSKSLNVAKIVKKCASPIAGPSDSGPAPAASVKPQQSSGPQQVVRLTPSGFHISFGDHAPQAISSRLTPKSLAFAGPSSAPGIYSDEAPSTDTSSPPESASSQTTAESSVSTSSPSGDNGQTSQEEVQKLSDKNYFKCGNKNCDFDTASSSELNSHLIMCDFARESQRLTCKFCNKGFKVPASLIEHLRRHGPPRFSCSLCDLKDPLKNKVISHQRTAHQVRESLIIPCDNNLTDNDKDYFIVRPRERIQIQAKLGKKPDKDKTKFTPEEVKSIPQAAVFFEPLGCALCTYSTKVRSNLVRHVKQHEAGSGSVAALEILNPVPERRDNERPEFDKMMNLAGSSHRRTREEEEEDTSCPFKFVPDQLRFRCHVENCNYLSLKDTILREHISVIHKDETSYTCPHCEETPVSVPTDQLLMHLKLHDCPLFRCSSCKFYSHMRNSIERHQKLSHAGVDGLTVSTVRNARGDKALENQSLLSTSTVEGVPEEVEVFVCNTCHFRTKTLKLMQQHLTSRHKPEKPFRCPLCNQGFTSPKGFRTHQTQAHKREPKTEPLLLYTKVWETPQPAFLPLWKRDNKRIKLIRGILMDERGDAPPPVLTCSSQDNVELMDVLELKFGKYGTIDDKGNMVCPRCPRYATKSKVDMRDHLYKDTAYKPISCGICKIAGACRKKVEKHVQRLHNIDQSELANHIETKEDPEIEQWVQNVISTQQSQLKTSPVDDHDHGTNKKRRRSSLDDPGLAKLKKTNSGEALTVPATVPLVPSADPIYGQISLEDYVLDGDSDFSSQDDCASLDEAWKPDKTTKLVIEPNRRLQLRNSFRHKCNQCGATTKFKTSLALHQRISHPDHSTKFVEDPQEVRADGYSCVFCNCVALYMHDLKTHWAMMHKPSGLNLMIKRKGVRCTFEYQCYLCKKLGNVFTLEEHFIANHPGEKVLLLPVEVPKYKCSECKIIFNSIDILNRHFGMDHPNKDFCFLVVSTQKPFPTPSPDSSSVSRVASYKCFTCHFVSAKYHPMVRHVQRHYTTYQCRLCDALFPTVFSIRSHMNTNHPGADTKPLIFNGSEEDLEKAKRNIVVICENGKKRKITEEEIDRGELEDDAPQETPKLSSPDEVKSRSLVRSPLKETARKSTGSPKKSSPPKLKVGLRKNSPKKKKKFTLSDFNVEVHSRGKKIKFRASRLENILDLNAQIRLKAVDSDEESI